MHSDPFNQPGRQVLAVVVTAPAGPGEIPPLVRELAQAIARLRELAEVFSIGAASE